MSDKEGVHTAFITDAFIERLEMDKKEVESLIAGYTLRLERINQMIKEYKQKYKQKGEHSVRKGQN